MTEMSTRYMFLPICMIDEGTQKARFAKICRRFLCIRLAAGQVEAFRREVRKIKNSKHKYRS